MVRKDLKLLLYLAAGNDEISITAKNPGVSPRTQLFNIEVGSYDTEEEARQAATNIEQILKTQTIVAENKYDHFFRIQFDPLPKDLADALGEKLLTLGIQNIRIVALQETEIQTAAFVRIFDAEGARIADTAERLVCFPENPADFIRFDGNAYRGALEIFINTSGKMTAINRLNIEDYLKGVIPGEMSGKVYPMIEALKAQAVAARTYAVKNLGQFAQSGYDLCATPLCQVYKGVSVESDITNRAVDETEGIVAAYNGELINALYTSTCGGHTENVENIFPDIKAPYMRGVTCYPETTDHGIILLSKEISLYIADDGKNVNREIALLDAAGFLDSSLPLDNQPVNAAGFNLWMKRFHDFLNLKTKPALKMTSATPTIWDSASCLMNLLDWNKRVALFLDEKDTVDLNQFKDFKDFPKDSLKEIGYLLREEILSPFPDNTLRLGCHMNYPSLARMLFKFISSYNLITLKTANFLNYNNGRIQLMIKGEPSEYTVVPQPLLFYGISAEYIAADRLLIRPGDKIEFFADASGNIKFISLLSHRKGVSEDRFSNLYFWEQSFNADDMTRQVNSFIKVGKITDIVPLEYGVSGRVTKLKITGNRGSAELKGLEIRRVLGIKENLFIMEKIYNSLGEVAYYFFTGKGWGHGVGMCQVGAYGMALRGVKFDEILKHYYTGIELRKIVQK
jgi:stage II sporulation protein D